MSRLYFLANGGLFWPISSGVLAITVAVALGCLSVLLYKAVFPARPAGFPPGPDGLPIVGCVFDILLNNPFAAFKRYAEEYGDVFSVKLGPMYMVICHGIRANREALLSKGDDFAGRPDIFVKSFGAGGRGIITRPYDKTLPEQRRFALKCIKGNGLEGKSMEQRIQREADVLARDLSELEEGRPFDVARYLQCGTCNVMCSVAFSKRFEHSDPMFQRLLDQLDEQFNTNPFKFLLQLARFLPRPLRKRLPYLDLASPSENIVRYIRDIIAEHRQNYDPDHLRDIIDAFFDRQEKYRSGLYRNARETYESFTDDQLAYLLLDFFFAGTETTSATLNWAILYMVRYPVVQRRVQEELDQIYGRDTGVIPTLQDKARLPYTSATLLEIQRIRPVAPLGTPHSAIKDALLSGYQVPKGSTVINDLWSIHMDEAFWENPGHFDPTRMMNEDNDVIKPFSFLPFATGPRACLGEQLAKTELFIFFTTLMHRFEFSVPKGGQPPTDEPTYGISLTPKHYEVITKRRL